MDFLTEFIMLPAGGFLIVLLGALFLFAEVLVKGRFIFGLLGFTLISSYFMVHIQEGMALWMVLTFIIGISLVVLDGKFIGDGTLGGLGLIVMLMSLAIPSPTILYGVVIVFAFIFGTASALLFLKFFPRRDLWSKLVLKDTLSSEEGYNSLSDEYKQLIGLEGEALTDFRPSGTVKVGGKTYSAVTQGTWIKKGSRLKVSEVNGTRILVQLIEDEQTDE
ncbi:NfeD family protein [Caldalkalibacillus salinus]|uniref:NfeD family protein n=1 Tax=Caldalkalibacillus salinus TaxID=2803787 RepID=UPI001923554F|nr:NfeD family protein [Caldalkalibacillus salinus]